MEKDNGRLAGYRCVITGATSGVGRVIAWRFAEEGAHLVINGRNAEAGETLVSELRERGSKAEFVGGDIGDERTSEALAEVALRWGGLETVVLNAGFASFGNFWEANTEDFDRMMRTNVRGAWLCARALHSHVVDHGSVVITASVSSHVALPGETLYSVSKGAVLQLARGMAAELAPRGIRVNALCPGGIGGVGMHQRALDESPEAAAELNKHLDFIPLGRLAEPEEIASSALFLASKESSYITGASLLVDGGMVSR